MIYAKSAVQRFIKRCFDDDPDLVYIRVRRGYHAALEKLMMEVFEAQNTDYSVIPETTDTQNHALR